MKICAIVAMNSRRAIGLGGKIPWHIPEDMQRFAKLTKGHTVLMGRRTWDSLPDRFRPLPERANIVATRSNLQLEGATTVADARAYVEQVKNSAILAHGTILWIIGGEQLYSATMDLFDEIYLTVVDNDLEGDAYFPEFEDSFEELTLQLRDTYKFIDYRRRK